MVRLARTEFLAVQNFVQQITKRQPNWQRAPRWQKPNERQTVKGFCLAKMELSKLPPIGAENYIYLDKEMEKDKKLTSTSLLYKTSTKTLSQKPKQFRNKMSYNTMSVLTCLNLDVFFPRSPIFGCTSRLGQSFIQPQRATKTCWRNFTNHRLIDVQG